MTCLPPLASPDFRSLRVRKDGGATKAHAVGMTATDALTATLTSVLQHVPDAAAVLASRGMACAGCPFARFDTVAEGAAAYGLDGAELVHAILAAALPRAVTSDGDNKS
jgi:hybrid cluster-associated redox disulfide protein